MKLKIVLVVIVYIGIGYKSVICWFFWYIGGYIVIL